MLHRFLVWFLQCLGFDPRGIFRYHDGRRYRNADPTVLVRKMWSVNLYQFDVPGENTGTATPFDSIKARELIRSGNADKVQKGYAIVSAAAREIFDVKPLSEGGLTETECDDLLNRFETYLGDLKKNSNGMLTCAINSGEEADEKPLNTDSDSGSTSNEQVFEMPDVSDLLPPLETTRI